ncbi:MAG: queuosine precursor transporter [Pseudomonadota bacterium]
MFPASDHSILSNEEFHKAFLVSASTFFAAMVAFSCSQFVDIRIFHFVKKATQDKWLWARNNLSTITAQFIDTTIFLFTLFLLDVLSWDLCMHLHMPMFMIKTMIALFDTPFFYLGVRLLGRQRGDDSQSFSVQLGQEMA